jgi:hypothetical protein
METQTVPHQLPTDNFYPVALTRQLDDHNKNHPACLNSYRRTLTDDHDHAYNLKLDPYNGRAVNNTR